MVREHLQGQAGISVLCQHDVCALLWRSWQQRMLLLCDLWQSKCTHRGMHAHDHRQAERMHGHRWTQSHVVDDVIDDTSDDKRTGHVELLEDGPEI